MAKKTAKGSGGKQSRSEIIQARLSPKIRFAAELMARKERRTLSSMIEALVENAAKDFELTITAPNSSGSLYVKLDFILEQLWSSDEALRFVRLAFTFPQLLNAEEEVRWTCIRQTPYFWRCYQMVLVDKNNNEISKRWNPHHSLETLVLENVHQYWNILSQEKIDKEKLPSINQAGGIISAKGHDKDEVAAINVKLNVDLSPLNHQEQQQWLSAYIQHANKSSNEESSDVDSATRVMADLVTDIIQGREK